MKKIIYIVVGIIFIALIGRAIWAYQAVKKDEAKVTNIIAVATTTIPETTITIPTITTKSCSISIQEQANETLVSGRVVFPKGISTSDKYTATGDINPFIDKDGNFCSRGVRGKPHLVMFLGPHESSFQLATIVINSDADLNGLIVDAKSTAVALVFIGIGPSSSIPKILDKISSNTDVLKFATDIDSLSNLTSSDLNKGGRLFNQYTKAVYSVLKSLSTNITGTTTPTTKSQQLVITNINTTSDSSSVTIMFKTNVPAYGAMRIGLPSGTNEKAICSDGILVDTGLELTLSHTLTVSGLCPNIGLEIAAVAYLSLDPVAQEKSKVLSGNIKVRTTN